ncbi:hypothetical protein V6N13_101946 [Hibiscus sabdariffa]
MCKCRSHGTFPLFGLQSSHLNICYYHQDLHRRPLRPGSRPGFYGDRRALLLIGAWPLPRRPGIGHALKRHPFSGLVDSAVLLTKNGPLGALDSVARLNEAAAPSYLFKVLRIGRGRCAPDASNHWLYPIELAKGSSYPEGNFGGNQLLDGIVHHLSGPDRHALTRTLLRRSRLLGPCFKTGRMGSPQADARSTLVPKHAETARAGFHDRGDDVSTGVSKARAWAATTIHVGPRPEPIGGPALAVPHPTGAHRRPPIRFPPDNFKHSLTLFSKSFSSFPRGAAFPNNPTRRQRLVVRQGPGTTGLSPSPAPLSRGLGARSVAEDASPDYNSDAEGDRFSSWAIPGSLAVTKGILAGFDNDPSAGSPTETLLRLLLPLNDKVQWTSRDVTGSEPPTSPRSEHFTGPFNRAGGTTRPIKARSASPAVGTSRPVLTVRRTGRPTPRSNYELFNCNNLNIRYWSWNYRGCWHQTCPPMDPR